ncbi:MAG TPA: DUF4238 domain-containing protein [Cellvibrio sp.]
MAKDHYVSQTYLSSFSNNAGFLIPYYKRGRITQGKSKSTSSICFEIDGDSNRLFSDPRIVDEYLRLFENNWATSVSALKNMQGGLDAKYAIAGYISFLQRCTPTAKRLAQNYLTHDIQPLIEGVIKECIGDSKLEPDIRNLFEQHQNERCIEVEITPEYAHAMAINALVDGANSLFCSHWLVLFNNTEIPFITSDNPAVLYYENDHNCIAKTFIPLSPSLGVLITPFYISGPPSKIDMQEFNHDNDLNREIKEEYVYMFNELIVRSAEKLVLHSEKKEWLSTMVEKNKTWRVEALISKISCEDSDITKYNIRAIDTGEANS